MPRIDPDRDYSPAETSAIVNETEGTLATKRSQGRGIPYRKYGRTITYPGAEIIKYLDDCLVTPTSAKERRRQKALETESKSQAAA
jgi:hypothetical protein